MDQTAIGNFRFYHHNPTSPCILFNGSQPFGIKQSTSVVELKNVGKSNPFDNPIVGIHSAVNHLHLNAGYGRRMDEPSWQ
ncbi:hypothetical protein T05_12717 [Trichinella murrelli]|uniref:Uncharacterized protein n=1 Tax=Trichinella murrelli TaxID=144512 RepID=A0A0V0TU35_9BILA|nr:hypothetical protein T05_12717 [Trichinella murrelli]